MKTDKSNQPPKIIYLQWYDEDGEPFSSSNNFDVTWCQDEINDTDVAYILRADSNKLLAVLGEIIDALEQSEKDINKNVLRRIRIIYHSMVNVK